MKQNNMRRKLKAIVAVMLVMTTLFSISTMVSAGFVKEVFEEVCGLMTTSSANSTCGATSYPIYCNFHDDVQIGAGWNNCQCGGHTKKMYSQGCWKCDQDLWPDT